MIYQELQKNRDPRNYSFLGLFLHSPDIWGLSVFWSFYSRLSNIIFYFTVVLHGGAKSPFCVSQVQSEFKKCFLIDDGIYSSRAFNQI